MKKISIIIVTYNSLELIKDCIDSIFRFNDIPDEKLEIIVVDNSDEKASVQLFDYVEKEYGERIILIKNKVNLGYGQGNNVGINAATGELVCVMNPDVRFLEPLLLEVQHNFELDATLCLLGFKQMGGGNISFYMKPECNFGIFTSLIIKAANRFDLFFKKQFHLSGAFMFLDKNKFAEVGQFDENFFLYYEEADIAAKIQKGGYGIKYQKDKRYLHLVDDRGFTNLSSLNTGFKSLKRYFEKHNFDKNKFFKTKIMDYKFKIVIARILGDSSRVSNIKNEMALFKEAWFSHFESSAVQ